MNQLDRADTTYKCSDTEVINLGNKAIKIEVSEGIAWITYKNQDIALYAGKEIILQANKRPVLVSSGIEKQQVVFTAKHQLNQANIRNSNEIDRTDNPLNLINMVLNFVK